MHAARPDGPVVPPSSLAFLGGGGDMGQRIRDHDWAATPLGPIEHWPGALRTTLRILLTTHHPVFVFWGPEHLCLYNDAYSRSLGPEKHPSMLGAPGREAWDEIWPVIGPQIEQVMAGVGSTWHENQLLPITRHGRLEEVYWTYSYGPIDDASAPGSIGGVLVLCTETTQQVLTAQRLQAQQQRWRALFDQAPGFMCVLTGPQHRYEYANLRYMDMTGGRVVMGRTVVQCLPELQEQGFIALLDDVYRSGQPHVGSAASMTLQQEGEASPQTRFLDFVYQPIRDEAGQVTGIFVEGQDITSAKTVERAQRATEQRARDRAEELEALMNSVPAFIWFAHDRSCERVTGNLQALRLTGMDAQANPSATPAVPVPRTFTEYVDGRPADPQQLPLQRAARTGQPVPPAEVTLVFTDGRMRQLYGGASPLYDGQGQVRGAVAAFVDITALKDAQQRLRDAERRKDEFLATLAHELRNPLAPLRTGLHLLERGSDGPAAAGVRTMMDRQLTHMVRLIDDLLDVARISAGKMMLRKELVTLQAVADVAVEACQPAIEAGRHRLRVQHAETPVWVQADLTRLAQVIGNLLNNAAKYTPEGGHIALAVARQGDQAMLSVSDDGIGIPPAMLGEVFQMFTQVNASLHRTQGGLGIGLALARSIVELHDGTIHAASEGLDCGSRFTFALPAVDPSPALAAGDAAAEGAPQRSSALRILVVDDNRDAADTLALLLELEGYEVRATYDGAQGLDVAAHWWPQVAFVDIGMPGLDGHELARRLRRGAGQPQPMLVAVTGWGTAEDERRSHEAGFDHHLTKPVATEAVQAVLRRLPGLREGR